MTRHNGSQVVLDNLPLLMVKLRSWLLNTQTGLTDHSLLPRDCGDVIWLALTNYSGLAFVAGRADCPATKHEKATQRGRKRFEAQE